MEQLKSHLRAERHKCQLYSHIHVRFLSCVISLIVLHTLPSPPSAVLLKVSVIVSQESTVLDTLFYSSRFPHTTRQISEFHSHAQNLRVSGHMLLYIRRMVCKKQMPVEKIVAFWKRLLRCISRSKSFRKSLKFFGTFIASLDPETVELPAFFIISAMFTGV